MLTLKGKSIVTSDWHFGVHNNDLKYAMTLKNVVKNIIQYTKGNSIENLIFCGDLFHQRNVLSIDTINIATRCMESLAKNFKNIYLILGNHDLFNKSNTSVHSSVMFRNIKNVTVVENGEICDINGSKCLFAPWLTDIFSYEKEEFDMLFGHFEISEKYLINSLIENCKSKHMSDEDIKRELENDELLKDSGFDGIDFQLENTEETYVNRQKSSELIGNWVEVVKNGGTIFAGHIHNRKEFYTKGRKFIFIGSPYQQTRGEMNSIDGFYVLDEDNSYEFKEIKDIPRYIDVKMSDIVKNIETFDFSTLSGNIIHKIYDIEVDPKVENLITQRIIDSKPYDEMRPDYALTATSENNAADSVDLIRKRKLDYMKMYINNMDDDMFDEDVSKDDLVETMKYYYDMAGGEY